MEGKVEQAALDQPAYDKLKASFDALVLEEAADDALIADLRAQISGAAPVQYIEATDFSVGGAYGFQNPKGYVGQGTGPDRTVYRLKPHSSTKTAPTTGTNPFRIMMAGAGASSGTVTQPEIANLTIAGTDQTPTTTAYGGIRVGYSVGAHLHDLIVTGIPGYSSSPPGETFSIAMWHADDSLTEQVICDGRIDGKGTAGIAASLFSRSSCKRSTFKGCTAQYAEAGFGATTYISATETWEDSWFINNRKHLNLERTYGGVHRYTRCHFRGASVPYVAQVSTDPTIGSASVIFEDCDVDGDGILRVRVYGPSDKNSQKDSDIKCIQKGVDVTSNASKFLLVRSG